MKTPIETLNSEVTLEGKTILVTGSSGGIGRSVALACAGMGATVILNGRNLTALNEIYDSILSQGNPEPAIVELDLAEATEAEYINLCGIVKSSIGSLHGVVHCATHLTELGRINQLDLTSWEQLFRVNVIAPALLIKNCEPLFAESGYGSVVLTSDNHALSLDAYWSGYAISKSALNAYATLQSNEWHGQKSYRINLVTPGPINSPMRSRTHPGEDRGHLRSIDSLVPTYLYLLSDSSHDISGENFGY
ncbi:MAG: SDR family NAD(P)-dependent oxidoreductase [Burkholderiales bacterium]|nr:SDR family NAD(P)-dependent oxidoreductase [Burkholderiales bacterium]OUT79620.1 MAG: hypothetical protein CBB82_00555 [Betaproteobacteria bacterium TMED22]|tara:strand:- start:46734 stop:47480 length:747 start_codon:yes stop_codon:yes gene_type:complete